MQEHTLADLYFISCRTLYFHLHQLAGPKGVQLKVKDPEKYQFRPKAMLKDIVCTFLNFASFEGFHAAAAANRYIEADFDKAVSIIKRVSYY